jgi:drug/metabolite transporter (DMT)-like permease
MVRRPRARYRAGMPTADATLESRSEAARGQLQGRVALLFVQLFFGLFPLFGKWAMREFSARAVAGWRIAAGACALLLVAALLHGRKVLPRRVDLPRLQACALLGVVLNMLLFLEGLRRSTAVNAGLIVATIPVFTFAIAVAVRQERFELARGSGILLAFLGVSLLFLQRGPDFTPQTLSGNAMMAINACCYSVFLVAVRPLLQRYPPLVVIAWVFVLSAWTVPLFAWDEAFAPAGVSSRGWLSLGYVLVFPTVLAYLLNTFALSKVSASTTAVFIFLQPLIVVASGVLVLGEALLPITLAAAITTLAGVWLVVRRRAPAKVASRGIAR